LEGKKQLTIAQLRVDLSGTISGCVRVYIISIISIKYI
jgi:hypothetical protein